MDFIMIAKKLNNRSFFENRPVSIPGRQAFEPLIRAFGCRRHRPRSSVRIGKHPRRRP
jgi:hypothetical protein